MTLPHKRIRAIASCAPETHLRAPLFASAAALLFLLSSPSAALAQQQSPPRKVAPRPAAKSDPRFAEVEAMLQQGRLDEAKQKLLDVLANEPKSIEGYNLLGIVCISQKDYQG
ncbi:MAG TPA: hypothetical protein VFN20_04335, partial [Candidatus Acidoferrum sp.]|nr:hypothetical protein [Candidatus Acidoferrum sp.]